LETFSESDDNSAVSSIERRSEDESEGLKDGSSASEDEETAQHLEKRILGWNHMADRYRKRYCADEAWLFKSWQKFRCEVSTHQ
jgi:hypothetical protein